MNKCVFPVLVFVAFCGLMVAHADERTDILDAWGKDYTANWKTSTKLDSNVPGLGEKGDDVTQTGSVEEKNGIYTVTLITSINGRTADRSFGVVGWDAQRKKVRLESFSEQGGCTTVLYTRKGNSWTSSFTAIAPDGSKSTSRGTLTISGDTHVWKLTKRMQGDTELPDIDQTWTKQ